jgi:hypothetical protein
MALGHVLSEYFNFLYQFSFRQLLHTHHLSPGADTIGPLVVDVPNGRSLVTTLKKIHAESEVT